MKESISKHGIRPDSTLINDGGPENQGEVSGFVAGNPNIKQLIAQKDIIQFNGWICQQAYQILLPLQERIERPQWYYQIFINVHSRLQQ